MTKTIALALTGALLGLTTTAPVDARAPLADKEKAVDTPATAPTPSAKKHVANIKWTPARNSDATPTLQPDADTTKSSSAPPSSAGTTLVPTPVPTPSPDQPAEGKLRGKVTRPGDGGMMK